MSRKISKAEALTNRFNPIILLSIVCLSLALVVFLYYQTYSVSVSASSDTSPPSIGVFDEKTISKIKTLNSSTTGASHDQSIPPGRVNPFVEPSS